MFYDVHAHLTNKAFNSDRIQIIENFQKNSISIVENGFDFKTNKEVLELASKNSNIFAAIGAHPLSNFDLKVLNQIRENEKSIVGVGEVGLDYMRGGAKQHEVFNEMIKVAQDLNKPLIVHSRKAHKKIVQIIKDLTVPVILHSFDASRKLVLKAAKLNHVFFSIPSIVKYSEQYQWMVKNIPISKLLCETDSPYLWKFGRNNPLNVLSSYKSIADIKNLELEKAEGLIEKNVRKVLKIKS